MATQNISGTATTATDSSDNSSDKLIKKYCRSFKIQITKLRNFTPVCKDSREDYNKLCSMYHRLKQNNTINEIEKLLASLDKPDKAKENYAKLKQLHICAIKEAKKKLNQIESTVILTEHRSRSLFSKKSANNVLSLMKSLQEASEAITSGSLTSIVNSPDTRKNCKPTLVDTAMHKTDVAFQSTQNSPSPSHELNKYNEHRKYSSSHCTHMLPIKADECRICNKSSHSGYQCPVEFGTHFDRCSHGGNCLHCPGGHDIKLHRDSHKGNCHYKNDTQCYGRYYKNC